MDADAFKMAAELIDGAGMLICRHELTFSPQTRQIDLHVKSEDLARNILESVKAIKLADGRAAFIARSQICRAANDPRTHVTMWYQTDLA